MFENEKSVELVQHIQPREQRGGQPTPGPGGCGDYQEGVQECNESIQGHFTTEEHCKLRSLRSRNYISEIWRADASKSRDDKTFRFPS